MANDPSPMGGRGGAPSSTCGILARAALLALLLLATGLRFYKLDFQSFWNDEGNTARLVERSIPLMIEGAAGDIHPPGYYLMLHSWRALVGESEFALRGFSALCGVLAVAVAATVGRRAGGRETALGAAFLVALHPLAVYYSQEARMYAQLGLVSALTMWAAVELQRQTANDKRQGRDVLRFAFHVLRSAFCITLGLYTQYAYVFTLVGLNLAFGVTWLSQRPWKWKVLPPWIAAHALGGLAFLPWAPIALGAGGWRPPDLDSGQALQAVARTLLTGITLPENIGSYFLLPAGVLLVLAALTRSRSRFAAWAAAGMALIPPVLILGLGIYRPAYLKFLMTSVAPLAVVLALPLSDARQGVATPRRWGARLLLLALIPAQVIALRHLYVDPRYARDDYRGVAARIAAEGRPGDAILLDAPNQWEVFTYYYRGPLPVYPAPYRPTLEEAAAWLDDIVAKHERLFVLYWGDVESDPEHRIESLLARRAYKAGDVWITAIRLARYGTAPLPEAPATQMDIRCGERIILEGYALPDRPYAGGDIVPLTLFWRANDTPGSRLKVFVHLVDGDGSLIAQTDTEPGGGFALTDRWQPGEQVEDRYGVLLPATAAPGEYTLIVGMYDFSGERLPIAKEDKPLGDALPLAKITVASRQ